jgi:hypothetical protein
MMLSGTAYRLAPLVRLTKGTGSGLLPTPVSSPEAPNANANVKCAPKNLLDAAKTGWSPGMVWPTPTVKGNYNRKGVSKTSGNGLSTVVKMFATPTVNDAKNNNGPSQATKGQGGRKLNVVVGGKLNPVWVEWLMGFPEGWTDLSN